MVKGPKRSQVYEGSEVKLTPPPLSANLKGYLKEIFVYTSVMYVHKILESNIFLEYPKGSQKLKEFYILKDGIQIFPRGYVARYKVFKNYLP